MTSAPDHRMSASSTKSIRKLSTNSRSCGGRRFPSARPDPPSPGSGACTTSRPNARASHRRAGPRFAEEGGGAVGGPSMVIAQAVPLSLAEAVDSIARSDFSGGITEVSWIWSAWRFARCAGGEGEVLSGAERRCVEAVGGGVGDGDDVVGVGVGEAEGDEGGVLDGLAGGAEV